jgi:hypothetical protein
MIMGQKRKYLAVALVSLGFLIGLGVSLAAAPLALASSQSSPSGGSYPIELMRAHTNYMFVDPAPVIQVGLGVHGDK